MGAKGEDGAADQRLGSGLDHAHGAVAVFHGEGELALLQRAAHPLALGCGNESVEDEPFRAAADTAIEHADLGIGRPAFIQRCLAQVYGPA